MELVAKVITVSDSVAHGHAEDTAGRALEELLSDAGFSTIERSCVADGIATVAEALRGHTHDFVGLVITTGGTGFGLRDLTPEATRSVLEREAPGIAEAMRLVDPLGRLSRAVAGTIGRSLVLNTPGSPRGAVQCLGAVIDVVPHALELLAGGNPHPHQAGHSPTS